MTRGWEEEHLRDPVDMSDAYALLDDGQVLAAVESVDPHEAEDREAMKGWNRRYRIPGGGYRGER